MYPFNGKYSQYGGRVVTTFACSNYGGYQNEDGSMAGMGNKGAMIILAPTSEVPPPEVVKTVVKEKTEMPKETHCVDDNCDWVNDKVRGRVSMNLEDVHGHLLTSGLKMTFDVYYARISL